MQQTTRVFREVGIDFCLVHIPAMLKHVLAGSLGPGYRTRPGCRFCREQFTQPVLCPSELNGLNQLFALKKQVERLAGRLAAKTLISRKTGLSPDEIEIQNDASGAPVLAPALDYAISITHSGDYAMAAAMAGKANGLGVDMEAGTLVDIKALLHAGFSPKEQLAYAGADLDTILKIWTIKEALLKYRRTGLKTSAKKIQWLDKTLYENNDPVDGVTVKSYQLEKKVFSVVFPQKIQS